MVTQPVEATLIREIEAPLGDLDDIERPTGEDLARRATLTARHRNITMYNTRTFEPLSITPRIWPAARLKRHKDPAFPEWFGKPLFTRGIYDEATKTYRAPGVYKLGSIPCELHPSNPNRALYDTMGYPVCGSAHFVNEQEARLHLQKDHKSVWAREEERRQQRERNESLDLQREQAKATNALLNRLVTTEEANGKREAARARMANARAAKGAKQASPA